MPCRTLVGSGERVVVEASDEDDARRNPGELTEIADADPSGTLECGLIEVCDLFEEEADESIDLDASVWGRGAGESG